MPKATLPSTEKKSVKPKVVSTTTGIKKNDALEKEVNESVKKHAAHVNEMIKVQRTFAGIPSNPEARARQFFMTIWERYKAEHGNAFPSEGEDINLSSDKLCAEFAKTKADAEKCFFDTEVSFKETMRIICDKLNVLDGNVDDRIGYEDDPFDYPFWFGDSDSVLTFLDEFDKMEHKFFASSLGLLKPNESVLLPGTPILERDIYACGATDVFTATTKQRKAAQGMWMDRKREANVAAGYLLHNRIEKMCNEEEERRKSSDGAKAKAKEKEPVSTRTKHVEAGQIWRMKSENGPRATITRVENRTVFYRHEHEWNPTNIEDSKYITDFIQIFCKDSDHARVVRERKAKAAKFGLAWRVSSEGGKK